MVVGWAGDAFLFLTAAVILVNLAIATFDPNFDSGSYLGHDGGEPSISLFLLGVLCGLVGIPVTLVAVIFGIVRAIMTRQWGWLVTILIGTPLSVVLAVRAFYLGLDGALPAFYFSLMRALFPLASIPLLVGVYGVVTLRRSTSPATARSRSLAGVSLVAVVFLGASAVFLILTLATQLSNALLSIVVATGLLGLVFTPAAVIVGIVRAIMNRQWGWLAAILLGVALPVPAAIVAANGIHLDSLIGVPASYAGLPYVLACLIGLAFGPLTVVIYSLVGLWGSAARRQGVVSGN